MFYSRKFIKKSLDSVCKQKFNKFELILIDDGSTDNSKAILNIYKKENIHPQSLENGNKKEAIFLVGHSKIFLMVVIVLLIV